MRIKFLGAAQEVTGSMHLLELDQGSILIDCGFFQGRRDESRRRNRSIPREAVTADTVILSHAHIDHSGSLPTLVKSGFGGTIYSTAATRDLCVCMLRDSARIQYADADYLNRKHGDEPGYVPVEPLYDEEDALRAMERFVSMPYHRPFEPLPGVKARFIDAGHILGSAQIVLDVQENGITHRLVFTGDLGRKGLPIIRDPESPPGPVDYVVMESTYGNRVHGDITQMHGELERVIRETVARGGKIIVPAFAVGRTQELIYALNGLKKQGRLPAIPIFIDSPLAINVTEVFKLHAECFDRETRAFLEKEGNVFGFEGIQFMTSREESIRLNDLKGPAIIISAAGMAEAGRILHHLRNNVEDERNTILIVGFMAKHTLGRRLVERQPRVRIWGVERELRAHVEILDSFSAHADKNDLLKYATARGKETRAFFLVHGEPDSQEALRRAMMAQGLVAHVPEHGETFDLF